MSGIKIQFDLAPLAAKLALTQTAISKLEALEKGMLAALQPSLRTARALVQQPGYSGYTKRYGDRAKKPMLRSQMRAVTRIYPRKKILVGVAGPQYKKSGGGNHGHLLEEGHRISPGGRLSKGTELKRQQKEGWTPELVWNERLRTMTYKHGAPRRNTKGRRIVQSIGRVKGRPFLEPAARGTQPEAQAIFEAAAGRFLDEALRTMKDG